MKSFRGQLAEYGAITVAKYRRSNFIVTCKIFDNTYFIEFYNGRQSTTTRYTKDKNEANNWIKKQVIEQGFKRIIQ